jgi:hypothetical protein
MMRFRKKPVEINAWRASEMMLAAKFRWDDLPKAIRNAYDRGEVAFGDDGVAITTLEGTMKAHHDDWIIEGVMGELYPCKPDIFASTYEPVVEAAEPLVPTDQSLGPSLHINKTVIPG